MTKEEKTDDIQKDEDTVETDIDSEDTTPEVDDDLKNEEDEDASQEDTSEDSETGESSESQDVEDMLSDGTPADKEFRIKKQKYDELNEKSDLYDQFAPLLSKLRDKPELVEEVMENKKGETVEKRLERLEEATKEKQRNTLRTALSEAVNVWPDFRDKWEEVRPLFRSLEKQGIETKEALQRAYFAANPDAARKEERITAQQHENARGVTASAGGATKRVVETRGTYDMTDADREIARQTGMTEEAYAKHAKHIEKFKDL